MNYHQYQLICMHNNYSPTDNQNDEHDDIERMELSELLATCDIISIHLRLSPQSTKLINKQKLDHMKPGSILINTSRGAIIDQNDLIDALKSGKTIAGCGLDVYENEPLESDSPLLSLPNVVLTPHVGWTVNEVFDEFVQIAAEQLNDYLRGESKASELMDPKVDYQSLPTPTPGSGIRFDL